MGRPKGSLNKSTIAKMAQATPVAPEDTPEPTIDSVMKAGDVGTPVSVERAEEALQKREARKAARRAQKVFMSPIFECQLCKDLIWSEWEGHMKYCKCGRSFVDATRGYVRATIAAKRTGEFKEIL